MTMVMRRRRRRLMMTSRIRFHICMCNVHMLPSSWGHKPTMVFAFQTGCQHGRNWSSGVWRSVSTACERRGAFGSSQYVCATARTGKGAR
ncbi:hypothetical protein C8Q70DRAFT_223914 [Cubamyces menziesii]|nr:hypothetical protein C8Q70DRAFT_223914 [Cubamyces menziesii]